MLFNRSFPIAGLGLARRWRRDIRAVAAVEFAFIAPCMLMLMSLVFFAGEGFEVQRKVTMTMRTLTDMVTQQCDIGPNANSMGYTSPCPSTYYTYTQIVSAASTVMTPYDPTALQFTIAEIATNGSSAGAGTQVWCKYTAGGAGNCPGGSFPSNLSTSTYVIYGMVNYTYNPLGIWFQGASVTFSDSYYLLPRIKPTFTSLPSNPPTGPYVACSGC